MHPKIPHLRAEVASQRKGARALRPDLGACGSNCLTRCSSPTPTLEGKILPGT